MRMKMVFSLILTLGIAGGIGLYLVHNPELVALFYGISLRHAVLLVLMCVLSFGTSGLYLKVFAGKFGMYLRPREWFGLTVLTTMGNYLTPFSGGLIARASYLKHRHAFSYTRFLAMMAANYLIAFALISLTGIVTLLTLPEKQDESWLVLIFFFATLITVWLVSIFPSITAGSKNQMVLLAQRATEGLDIIRRDPVLLGKLIVLTLMNILIGALLFYVAFISLGSMLPFRVALLIYLLTTFTLLINITPGNFGIQEAGTSMAAAILGAGVEMGLMASLMIRAATILSAFSLGPVFSYLLSKELIAKQDCGTD
jgi:uncharacterized membrane protein YbhN (UPF0104 family)